jgi:hypothetical protein
MLEKLDFDRWAEWKKLSKMIHTSHRGMLKNLQAGPANGAHCPPNAVY